MLTHSIRPKSFLDKTIEHFRGATGGPASPKSSHTPVQVVDLPWTKLRFTVWLEGIKQAFKEGDLVTLRQIPYIPHKIPFYWRITYINELFHDVKYDSTMKEPICITVRTENNIFMTKCPGGLRKFTEEELNLVSLSDKKPAGIC